MTWMDVDGEKLYEPPVTMVSFFLIKKMIKILNNLIIIGRHVKFTRTNKAYH